MQDVEHEEWLKNRKAQAAQKKRRAIEREKVELAARKAAQDEADEARKKSLQTQNNRSKGKQKASQTYYN